MDYELMMNGCIKIGDLAPDFEASTTMGEIRLTDYKGKWVILFSHPGAFTPVCTTEMIAFARANTYFEEKNACLLGLSIDSNPSHLAWIYDIYCKTGVIIPFPIIADRNGSIARKYGMISNNVSNTETVRNVFIISPDGMVKAILVYPMNVGRCIPEIIRLLDALQIAEKCKSSIPANWLEGDPIIIPNPQTFSELQERVKNIKNDKNGMNWYLSFKSSQNCDCKNVENKDIKLVEAKNNSNKKI